MARHMCQDSASASPPQVVCLPPQGGFGRRGPAGAKVGCWNGLACLLSLTYTSRSLLDTVSTGIKILSLANSLQNLSPFPYHSLTLSIFYNRKCFAWFLEWGEGREKADRWRSGQPSARHVVHVSGHLACGREDPAPCEVFAHTATISTLVPFPQCRAEIWFCLPACLVSKGNRGGPGQPGFEGEQGTRGSQVSILA